MNGTATSSKDILEQALVAAAAHLLARRNADGFWEGHLSSSALSTATAMSALATLAAPDDAGLVRRGAEWLAATQAHDGGWGDTADSPSNLSTTLLCAAALRLAGNPAPAARERADGYVARSTKGAPIPAALGRIYGADRTFAVPILINCALAGMAAWRDIPGLPFELAPAPPATYRALRLHVVSYALPALIAVGLLLHRRHPSPNPIARAARALAAGPALRKLATLQPEHGGFLDATPLTSFVVMSLAGAGEGHLPVARRCRDFIRASVREDGSWPIDTNLAVWLTTGSLSALGRAGKLPADEAARTARWVAERQYAAVHPFTQAAPGGWGWTHLPGGVPDADDTAGAMLALAHGLPASAERDEQLRRGAGWLLGVQNADGGWPTFCRGWGRLPFDRSSPDVTAHALRALAAASGSPEIEAAVRRGFGYLRASRRPDGSWAPLWFGSQHTADGANPIFGTARVLLAYTELCQFTEESKAGMNYLMQAQSARGDWGAAPGVEPTVEETALAVAALASLGPNSPAVAAVARGAGRLAAMVADGGLDRPAPIGLYFASLWYSEALYPAVWTVDALARAVSCLAES